MEILGLYWVNWAWKRRLWISIAPTNKQKQTKKSNMSKTKSLIIFIYLNLYIKLPNKNTALSKVAFRQVRSFRPFARIWRHLEERQNIVPVMAYPLGKWTVTSTKCHSRASYRSEWPRSGSHCFRPGRCGRWSRPGHRRRLHKHQTGSLLQAKKAWRMCTSEVNNQLNGPKTNQLSLLVEDFLASYWRSKPSAVGSFWSSSPQSVWPCPGRALPELHLTHHETETNV